MRWHAKRDLVQPGACQKRDRAVRPSGQDQGHRPGPECLGKTGCDGRCGAKFKSGFSRRHVTDQRVESRPFLGGEDGGHGIGVAGIAAQRSTLVNEAREVAQPKNDLTCLQGDAMPFLLN